MDLIVDLVGLGRRRLQELGAPAIADDGTDSVLQCWLTLEARIPPRIKWTIEESCEIKARKALPTSPILEGLAGFEDNAKAGRPLDSHLSTTISKPDFVDFLLVSWNIWHFHLGVHPRDSRFVARTDEVLFALLDAVAGVMYQLDLLPHDEHSRGKEFVPRQELLAIIENNWPHLLEPHELKGIQPTGNYGNRQIKAFGAIGTNTLVVTPGGRAIVSMGGGISTAKTSVNATRAISWIRRTLTACEGDLRNSRSHLESKFGKRWEDLDFRLVEFGPNLRVVEIHSGEDVIVRRLG